MNKNITKGFTLIEFMVMIAVLIIVIAVAAPQFNRLQASIEADQVTGTLTSLLTESRTHAFIHRKRLGICASHDGETCDAHAWNEGVLIYHDKTANRLHDPHEPIHKYMRLDLKHGSLEWRGYGLKNNILFQPDTGMPRGSNGSFLYCASEPKNSRKIIMGDMGNPRFIKGSCV